MDCRGKVFACGEVLPLFVYESEAATLISAYKSRKRWSLAGFWADFIAVELRDRWPGCVVVPVPPRPEKRKAGQADQVELLARALVARGFRIERLLTRGASEQQKSLGREGRKVNSKAAYSLAPGVAVPREVVILDDVYTTGATVEACASALKAGGAAVVRAVVLAAD